MSRLFLRLILPLLSAVLLAGAFLLGLRPAQARLPSAAPLNRPAGPVTETVLIPLALRQYSGIYTITLWYSPWDQVATPEFQAVLAEYELAHPNIHISATQQTDMQAALAAAIPAGVGPDLVLTGNEDIGLYGLAGYITPLDAWVSPAYLTAAFEPAAAQGMLWRNHVWGLPDMQEGVALIYNRNLLNAAQLPAPTDFADLLTKAAQFQLAHPGKYYLCSSGLGGNDAYHAAPVYFGHGLDSYGGYLGETTAYLTTTAAISAANWIAALRPYAPLTASYSLCQDLFTAGNAAIWWTGPWALNAVRSAGINYGIAAMGSPFVGLRTYLLTPNAVARWHAQPAVDLILHLSSAAVQSRLAIANAKLPANTAALNAPAVQALPDLAGFGAALHPGVPMSPRPFADCQWGPVGQATSAIWNNTQPPLEAMQTAQAAILYCLNVTLP
jgi:arabinogalactan oligomer/maltooligosaccharide transport system substrate-binding protein